MSENSKIHAAKQRVKTQYGEGIQDHPNFNQLVEEELNKKPAKKITLKKR